MNKPSKLLLGCCGIGLWALLLTPTWANWQDAVPGAQIIGTVDLAEVRFVLAPDVDGVCQVVGSRPHVGQLVHALRALGDVAVLGQCWLGEQE